MYSVLKNGFKKNMNNCNYSYNILQKELEKKVNVIKELNDTIKKLECENNYLNGKINQIKYQNTLNIIHITHLKN